MIKYFGGFTDRDSIAREFNEGKSSKTGFIPKFGFPTDEEILFAAYEGASYEGDAIVLFERDGELYEVNGSHCSCYGLEDQWKPEETSWEAINLRPKKGFLSKYDYAQETIKAFWDLVDSKVKKEEI